MKHVTKSGALIGHVEKYLGNKASERWMAYRPREAGNNETFPRRKRGFPTQREAVAWLGTEPQKPSDIHQTSLRS